MNALDIGIVNRKVNVILSALSLIDEIEHRSKSSVEDHAYCHAVQNIINAVIDISQHICKDKLDTIPETYAASIEKLSECNILDATFAKELANIARLRNVIVHAYDSLDTEYLWNLRLRLKKDINKFLKALSDNNLIALS